MDKSKIRLTSAEIAALWSTYIQNTATQCFYRHFLSYLEDEEIKPIMQEALSLSEEFLAKVKAIFEAENFPIPKGFSDSDMNPSAPALFTDLFGLSFVYRGGQMIVVYYADALSKVGRQDVLDFYQDCLSKTAILYKKSLKLMLDKGIYDRPPKLEYPEKVEFIRKELSLAGNWFRSGRPLNAIELSELFFAIERNGIGLVLLMGLLQASNDMEVKAYLKKGIKLTQKQIEEFNKFLKKNDGFEIHPVTLEVTNSTESPFSEKLILFFVTITNQVGIQSMATALSVSMRVDLGVQYAKFIAEIMAFADEGRDLLIKRGWLEQPPMSTDREKLFE
ncbi:DUF3231 family protein [Mesobacillus subterraneus]|uniref:DUF3231 family protein n=1 Tax=Mesobacillus subterraneus TaxID=285983 RepID=A0A427TLB7_9BACI|nr:DUF3231 family protein [Mesobacillus subterraneus]RSD25096.1 DUF3231 family protein [Mesobacillus subterraneus]